MNLPDVPNYPVCGICALDIQNKIHANQHKEILNLNASTGEFDLVTLPRTSFSKGSMAEKIRLEAVRTRENGTAKYKGPKDDSSSSGR